MARLPMIVLLVCVGFVAVLGDTTDSQPEISTSLDGNKETEVQTEKVDEPAADQQTQEEEEVNETAEEQQTQEEEEVNETAEEQQTQEVDETVAEQPTQGVDENKVDQQNTHQGKPSKPPGNFFPGPQWLNMFKNRPFGLRKRFGKKPCSFGSNANSEDSTKA